MNYTEWKLEPIFKVTHDHVFDANNNPFEPNNLFDIDGWEHKMVLYLSKTELSKYIETESRKKTV